MSEKLEILQKYNENSTLDQKQLSKFIRNPIVYIKNDNKEL